MPSSARRHGRGSHDRSPCEQQPQHHGPDQWEPEGHTNVTTPHDAHENHSKQDGQHSETLLRGRADPHDPGRAFELAGQFEEDVESGDPEPGDHQGQGQEVQDGSMLLSGQDADPQHGNDAHDERALIEAERTRFEAHAHARPQAPARATRATRRGRQTALTGAGWIVGDVRLTSLSVAAWVDMATLRHLLLDDGSRMESATPPSTVAA
jgi:hypothetical protein